MKNIGENFLARDPDETEDEWKSRNKSDLALIKEVFDNPSGRKLLMKLIKASPILAPRFGKDRTDTEAAFLDGEKSFLGFLYMHSGVK